MYLSHYKLRHMPFQISPDPRFLWLGEKHKEALAVLKYGVLNNQGFLLLTGDVGTGKTTMINTLVKSLDPETLFVNVADPRLDKLDFFKLVAHSFGLETQLRTKFDFLIVFKDFLYKAYDEKKKVLLILDEAQKLSLDSLEEIRLLSNIERPDTKLVNIFFVGQNEFNDTLLRPACRALRQRITLVHNIEPLNEEETAEYVKYRLRVAGAQREIFTDKALRKIHKFSRGYPRLINILCDLALVSGYSDSLQTIGPMVIEECSKDLMLPGEMKESPSIKVARRKRARMISNRRLLVFAGLAVFFMLSGFVVASGFLGDQGMNLKRLSGVLSSIAKRIPSDSQIGREEREETERPSRQNPVASQSPGEPGPRKGKGSPSDGKEGGGSGNAAVLVTEAQDQLFHGGRLIIPFEYNANELSQEILAKLDELVGYMQGKPNAQIVIKGFTDSQGSADYNKNLSVFRANVVKSYLTGKGISPSRMQVLGMGGASPRMPNANAEGRSANRRVEIDLVVSSP